MNRSAKKNRMMFLGGTIVAAIAIFISFGIFVAPQAHAYAIGSTSTSITPDTGTNGGPSAGGGSGYNAGDSFQNLISPFTDFFSSLKFNNNTTINTGGPTSGFPTVNLTPVMSNGVQNLLSQWLSEFDNWFYSVSGVQLSGIFQVLLNAILWTLNLAQGVVNWLLGLFH
jgi:hypothetical protein